MMEPNRVFDNALRSDDILRATLGQATEVTRSTALTDTTKANTENLTLPIKIIPSRHSPMVKLAHMSPFSPSTKPKFPVRSKEMKEDVPEQDIPHTIEPEQSTIPLKPLPAAPQPKSQNYSWEGWEQPVLTTVSYASRPPYPKRELEPRRYPPPYPLQNQPVYYNPYNQPPRNVPDGVWVPQYTENGIYPGEITENMTYQSRGYHSDAENEYPLLNPRNQQTQHQIVYSTLPNRQERRRLDDSFQQQQQAMNNGNERASWYDNNDEPQQVQQPGMYNDNTFRGRSRWTEPMRYDEFSPRPNQHQPVVYNGNQVSSWYDGPRQQPLAYSTLPRDYTFRQEPIRQESNVPQNMPPRHFSASEMAYKNGFQRSFTPNLAQPMGYNDSFGFYPSDEYGYHHNQQQQQYQRRKSKSKSSDLSHRRHCSRRRASTLDRNNYATRNHQQTPQLNQPPYPVEQTTWQPQIPQDLLPRTSQKVQMKTISTFQPNEQRKPNRPRYVSSGCEDFRDNVDDFSSPYIEQQPIRKRLVESVQSFPKTLEPIAKIINPQPAKSRNQEQPKSSPVQAPSQVSKLENDPEPRFTSDFVRNLNRKNIRNFSGDDSLRSPVFRYMDSVNNSSSTAKIINNKQPVYPRTSNVRQIINKFNEVSDEPIFNSSNMGAQSHRSGANNNPRSNVETSDVDDAAVVGGEFTIYSEVDTKEDVFEKNIGPD